MKLTNLMVAVFFVVFLFSPLNPSAANTTAQTATNKTQVQPKTPLPKIDIKKITLESEEKGAVPSGLPLMVSVEIKASEDFSAPFTVNLELKKGQEKQKFIEGIENLKQGSNIFKWDLTGKPEDGSYTLSVEVVNVGLKLKDKTSKTFRVGEKPKPQTTAANKTSSTAGATTSAAVTTGSTAQVASTTATAKSSTSTKTGGTTSQTTTTKSSSSSGTQEIKEITFAGVMLTGSFTQQSTGVYIGKGEIKPNWDYDIKLNIQGDLTIDTNQRKITGQLTIHVPVLGDIGKVTDLYISTSEIRFNGEAVEAFKLGSLTLQLAKATATFELSSSKIKAKAEAGVGINVTGIPGISEINIDIESVDAGFETPVEHPALTVSGSGTVEIPPTPVTPPLKVDLSGNLGLRADGLSGDGKVKVFDIEVGNGDFNINTKGIISLNLNAGVFEEGVVECNMAGVTMTIDMPKGLLTAGLSQEVKLLDKITIPGSVKADLEMNAKTKKMKVSGKAGIPLTGAISTDALSLGIKDFLFEMDPYNSTNPKIKLTGNAYVSLWTIAGFVGEINNAVLDGKGKLNLPPGLNKLLDMQSIDLPVRVDLRSGQTIAQLGGKVAGLAIKHFPLEGPEIILKNDGVHLKGQIGISHVITIPLGDLVFKKDESYTSLTGDIGLGPFTIGECSFTLPASASEGISFEGKIGIPGLAGQELKGKIYKEGKLEFSGLSKIGFINVDTVGKFAVSSAGLHADSAGLGVGLGGLAKCALNFSSLDINKSIISGTATGTFTGVLGVEGSLRGNFSFNGNTVTLSYPSAVSLCGISVSNVELNIGTGGVSGSGTISAAGQSKRVSISIENGIMKLKGPAGELIAEGMRIADKLADTTAKIASDEKKVITEDAKDTKENLARGAEPWINEAAALAKTAKDFYNAIDKIVSEEILSRVKSALDSLKKVVDAAVIYAKKGIAAAVDGVCDGIIAMIDGVKSIFSQIESLIPADYLTAYNNLKNKVIEKANTLKDKVVLFRDNTKNSLYNLTGTITAIYQSAIDMVTSEANKVASSIKKQVEPIINEMDRELTEMGQEVEAAKNAVGDEATQHYNIAKQKANLVKDKANNIINNYKNKISDLVSPYIQSILNKITPYTDKVAKVRDEVIAQGIEGLKEAKKTLDPYIKPFEDAVNELKDLASRIGGAVFQKFLQGVGAAGNALNSALGAAGAGLVKATDLVGDAAVAATGAAADVSQAVYNGASAAAGAVASGASAAVNFAQDTGTHAVNVAVDTAQQGYQAASEVASQVTSAASQAASQAYSTASQVSNNVQQQVSSTIVSIKNSLPSISPSVFATGSPVSFSQIQSGAQTVSAKINNIVNTLSGYASSAYNAASGAASSAGSAISSGASTVASGASSAWKGAKSVVSSIFGSGGSAPPPPPPDYSAPTISNVSATSTTNSITVTWNTSFSAKTLLFYSATPNVNYSGQDAVTTVASVHTGDYYPETTNHSITVSNLNPGTAYYYILYSYRTVSGNASDVAKQGIYSIVTQPTTAIVGGTIKDRQGNLLAGANIYVDNSSQVSVTTGTSGEYAIEVNPGTHNITVKKNDYLSSSTVTSSLSAGQILPLDFSLTDGKIYISGVVKEPSSGAAISSATVKLSGTPTPMTSSTDASGAFAIVVGMNNETPLAFSLEASKAGYNTYNSGSLTLARGSKMQNVNIILPRTPPALSGDVYASTFITSTTISFETQNNCSAFAQFAPQSSPGYIYQTPLKTNDNAFYFDLVSLNPVTTYKYKVVLQDNSGNTVVAKEGVFTTREPVIGLTATVNNITGNSAKLNINSSFRVLKHQLILRDTTVNTQILNQDLHVLASPVTLDLNSLIDGHNYTVELTSSALANITTGNAIKTEAKSVNFSVPLLPDFKILSFNPPAGNIIRGTTNTINIPCSIRVNHAITNASLKVFAGSTELFSQNFASFNPGTLNLNISLAVASIPGTDKITLKLLFQAGAKQEQVTESINILRPQQAAGAQAQQPQPKNKSKATAQ